MTVSLRLACALHGDSTRAGPEGGTLINPAVRPAQLVIALKELLQPGSVVVNIVTPAAFALTPKLATYTASKAALHVLSAALERELKSRGVRVVRVYPGATATEFFERTGARTPRFAVRPETVAKKVVACVEKGCREVFVPGLLGFLQVFSPLNLYRA